MTSSVLYIPIDREAFKDLMREVLPELLAEMQPLKEEYTEAEFCKLVGISRTTAYRMRQRGELKYILVGCRIRYTPEHVREFKERQN